MEISGHKWLTGEDWFKEESMSMLDSMRSLIVKRGVPEVLLNKMVPKSPNTFFALVNLLALHDDQIKSIVEQWTAQLDEELRMEYEKVLPKEYVKPKPSPLVQRFTDICGAMAETFSAKNADYGNSFDKSLDEDGLVAAKVRMKDKMNRFESLIDKDPQVVGESIEDTLLDLANYSIMTVMWMRGNQ